MGKLMTIRNTGRISAFFCACVLSLQAFGALLYQQDFEGTFSRTTWSTNSRYYEPVDGLIMDKQLWCYTVGGIGGYDSWRSSTTYKKSGSKSIRNELNGMKKNLECGGTEEKSRQSVHVGADIQKLYVYANGQVPNRTNHGDERWFGISYYYPSNEGTIGSWWGKDKYVNILQFMSSGNLDSPYQFIPEIFISLGGNGNVRVQNYYSVLLPKATDKKVVTTNIGRFTKDAWNDIVIHYKRNWTSAGSLTVWVNGVKAMERLNTPVAVRSAPSGYFDFGQYFAYTSTPSDGYRNEIYVQYLDNLKVGDHTSSYNEVNPSSGGAPVTPTCPGDPGCPIAPTEVSSSITGVNGGAAITQNQFPVNFTASVTGNAAYLACRLNNSADERSVVWNTTTNAGGYFSAGNINAFTSTTAALQCFYESYLPPIAANSSWAAEGVANTDYSGSAFGYTSGLTVTKSAGGTSRLVTKGDKTLYATVPVWAPTAGYEIEFDVIFPTSTTLGQTTDYILDSWNTGSGLKPDIHLRDSDDTIVFQSQTGRTLTMNGVAVTSGVTTYPTDGVPRKMKMVGTNGAQVHRILRRYTDVNQGSSTVYNLSLKDLTNSSNNSFYVLNEAFGSNTIIDTGARGANGQWFGRGAEDVISLGGGAASNPAYAYRNLGATHAFSGVAGDRMALDFTYSCTSTPNCSNLYFAVVDSSGDRRNIFKGTAGSLTADTLNGGFGTNKSTKNWTVDATAGVYRARIEFKVGAEGYSNNYSLYAGSLNGVAGQAFTIHSVIPHKNYVTKSSTYSVKLALDNVDTTPPDQPQCSMTSIRDDNAEAGSAYTARVTCTTNEVGGTDYVMITTTNTAPNQAAVKAGTGAAAAGQSPADDTTIYFEAGGFDYQNLWAWAVRCDDATTPNCSTIGSATFTKPAGTKKIKFGTPAVGRLKVGSAFYSGTFDSLKIYTAFPWVTETAPLIVIDDPAFVSGMATFVEADATAGSINSLVPATNYYFVAYDTDGNPFSAGEFQITVE